MQNWGQQYNIYGAKIQKWTKSYLLVMFQSDFQALKMIQKFSPLVTQGLLQSLACPFVALIYLTNATTDAWCKATFSRKTEHSCRPPFRVRPSVLHTRPKRHKTASFWKATFNNNFRAKSDFFYYFFLNKRLFCVIDTYCAFVEALELTIEPREKALLIFLLL